jgi:surface protein
MQLTNETIQNAVRQWVTIVQQPPRNDPKHISNWDTSCVTNMSGLFRDCKFFNEDLSTWDTSNVLDMSHMFRGATLFNQGNSTLTVLRWDTSNVTNMSYMFCHAISFNKTILSWDTSSVTNMDWMFFGAFSFESNNGSTDLRYDGFKSAIRHTIAKWNTLSVKDTQNSGSTDFQQNKLIKSEWDSLEVPISPKEKEILLLIMGGYDDVNIKKNHTLSIAGILKVESSQLMEDYLYTSYFKNNIAYLAKKYDLPGLNQTVKHSSIKRVDMIRIEKNAKTDFNSKCVYEFVLINHVELLLKNYAKTIKSSTSVKPTTNYSQEVSYHYFTLYKLIRNTVVGLNRRIVTMVQFILNTFQPKVTAQNIINNSVKFIEKNENLLKYEDSTLYSHQKDIFNIFKNNQTCPKLILYSAPTGTGKTITPIALAKNHTIIFVCAARHVGLALARTAISMQKKVAFAFGCSSESDIRLHNSAAKDFVKNRKTGGIFTIDHSMGELVEIMICDIRSFVYAMNYMKGFNPPKLDTKTNIMVDNLIVYWDEPTISLDYADHPLHDIIKTNWSKNTVSNVVFSSATLPKKNEINNVIESFTKKFSGAKVFDISAHDSKKTIPLINRSGMVMLPHYMCNTYAELCQMSEYFLQNLTMLRYLDLGEIVQFIQHLNANVQWTCPTELLPTQVFDSFDKITMSHIKTYYLQILKTISEDSWTTMYIDLLNKRVSRIPINHSITASGIDLVKRSHTASSKEVSAAKLNPGVYATTKDAFSLTDGPTIYVTDHIKTIATFYIQQANIPPNVMNLIMEKIQYNNEINAKIEVLSYQLEAEIEKCSAGMTTSKCANKVNRESSDDDTGSAGKVQLGKLTGEINSLSAMIKTTILNETFIPNKQSHKEKWAKYLDKSITNHSFTSNIDEHTIGEIMILTGIDDSWKILLMMGIGVFTNHNSIPYTEIMKKLADSQNLFMIIASSDYIYGTNYQFCHCNIGKEMNPTQQKLIQILGRIGRHNVQQPYTIRFRNDDNIRKLFTVDNDKPESANMNRLMIGD